ncbi:MAG: hypothetical protein K9M75_10570 [Phycisphaerae bacterium]|nr:hypothetical protein [Phycisphaerae bacterium]
MNLVRLLVLTGISICCFIIQGCNDHVNIPVIQVPSDDELTSKFGVSMKDFFIPNENSVLMQIPITPGNERDLAIKEMLFRLVMSQNYRTKEWYFDIDENIKHKDKFLERFDNIPVSIDLESAANRGFEGRVIGRTDDFAQIASVRIIRWIDDFTAEVQCSHYHGPLSGGGDTYKIFYDQGKWLIGIISSYRI